MIIIATLVLFWIFIFGLLIAGAASLNPDNNDKKE